MKDRIDEDSKKLYGIKAVSRDTKHLGIMIEAANIAEISKEKGEKPLTRNSDWRHKDSVGAAKERESNAMTNAILR